MEESNIQQEVKLKESNIGKKGLIIAIISLASPIFAFIIFLISAIFGVFEVTGLSIIKNLNVPEPIMWIILILILISIFTGLIMPIIAFVMAGKAKNTTTFKYRKPIVIMGIFGLLISLTELVIYGLAIMIIILFVKGLVEGLKNIGK